MVEGNYRAKITGICFRDHPYMMCDVVSCEEARGAGYGENRGSDTGSEGSLLGSSMEMAPKMAPDIVLEVQTTDDSWRSGGLHHRQHYDGVSGSNSTSCASSIRVKRLQKLLKILTREVDILKLETELSAESEGADRPKPAGIFYAGSRVKAITEELGEAGFPSK